MDYLDPNAGLSALFYAAGVSAVLWSGAGVFRMLREQHQGGISTTQEHEFRMAKLALDRDQTQERTRRYAAEQARYEAMTASRTDPNTATPTTRRKS